MNTPHSVVSREEWLAARKEHLIEEKKLTRALDALNEKRRALPWVKIDKEYRFHSTTGDQTLCDLFQGREQLILHHLMFTPGDDKACVGCSFQADHIDATLQHVKHFNVMITAVSRAPLREILPFKERMGWQFPWVSSYGSDFNYDFGVSFTAEQIESGRINYNFGTSPYVFEELPGLSVFIRDKDDGSIYHTYSTYARGLDMLINTHHYLDLTPKGRAQEEGRASVDFRYHNEYENDDASSCACGSGGSGK